MKTFVTILKPELMKNIGLSESLTKISEEVRESKETFEFQPREGKLMDFICVLLDKEVSYKLKFEPRSVKEKH
jgi:hypothetical protein